MKQAISIFSLLFFSLDLFSQGFNYYRGNLHAHTSFSDGNKENNPAFDTPLESYQYAKSSLHFDFLGISEHNHAGAGMSLANYALGLSQAAASTDPSFVALYGMEWGTISDGGHVIIYGFDSLIGWDSIGGVPNYAIYNDKTNYNGLFQKVANKPNAFTILAHPQTTDYDSLFFKPYNSTNAQAIVGLAYRSGPAFSIDTMYGDPSASTYNARYKDLLKLGYHAGPTIDHDNHYTTFGRTGPGRLVVLADSLTPSSLRDAIKACRFYASDDWNTEVEFTCNTNHYMGEKVMDNINPTFSVTVSDADLTDTVASIDLRYGIPGSGINATVLTSSTTNTLTYTHSINFGDVYYYYLEITQKDGDKIITAPIRYNKSATTSIAGLFETTGVKAFPNPASKNITFEFNETPSRIIIFDAQNKVVFDGEAKNKTLTIRTEHFPKGIYSYQVQLKNNAVASGKIVIQ